MLTKWALSATSFLVSFMIGIGLTNLAGINRHSQRSERHQITFHTASISAIATSPGGKYMASGDVNGQLKVWRTNAQDEAVWTSVFDSQVLAIAFSRNGHQLAVLTRSGQVTCFATENGKVQHSLNPLPTGTIEGGALGYVCGNEPTLMAYGGDALRRWAELSGNHQKLHPFDNQATCLAWSPMAERYLSGNSQGELKLFDKATHQELANWPTQLGNIHAVALSKDGNLIAAVGDHGLQIRNSSDGEILLASTSDHLQNLSAIAFSPRGSQVVTGDALGKLLTWDWESSLESAGTLTMIHTWGHPNCASARCEHH